MERIRLQRHIVATAEAQFAWDFASIARYVAPVYAFEHKKHTRD